MLSNNEIDCTDETSTVRARIDIARTGEDGSDKASSREGNILFNTTSSSQLQRPRWTSSIKLAILNRGKDRCLKVDVTS